MKTVAGSLMIANAALFLFGGVQHAGIAIGRFHEPVIIPAAIVETLCGLCLLWGAIALFRSSRKRWRVALIANLVALGGVLLGTRRFGCRCWSSHSEQRSVPSHDADPDRCQSAHAVLRKISSSPARLKQRAGKDELEHFDWERKFLENFAK